MNDWNWISRPLCVALCGSSLLVAPRVALAEDAAGPKGPDSPPPVDFPAPASASPEAPATPGEPPAPAATATPAAAPPPPVSAPPTPAPTPKKERVRLEIGGRVGYAIPLRDLSSGTTLKDVFSGSIPGVFDLWARIPGGWAIGGYFGLAAGLSGKALDTCADCSAFDMRTGLQGARHFADGGMVDPWVGIGLGFEWASITQRSRIQGIDFTYDNTYTALPEMTAQAGLDIGGDTIAFGPYVSISYAAFNKVKSTLSCSAINCNDGVSSSADVDGGGHGWLSIGLRGTYMR